MQYRTTTAFFPAEALVQLYEIVEGHLMPDHVHMLMAIPPKLAVCQAVGYIKGKCRASTILSGTDNQVGWMLCRYE